MFDPTRGGRIAIYTLVAVVLALTGVVVVATFNTSDTGQFTAKVGAVAAVLAVVGPLIGWAVKQQQAGAGGRERGLDELTGLLFESAVLQWQNELRQRELTQPLDVTWRLGPPELANPLASVVDVGARLFKPLPYVEAATVEKLRRGGGQAELHAAYGGLPFGRLVIIGPAGAGKSGAATLLADAALTHRRDRPERAEAIPVPLRLSVKTLYPNEKDFDVWVARRMVATNPIFSGTRGFKEAYDLVRSGRVSVILEDIDDIPPDRHRPIIELLGGARIRVVLTARVTTMQHATEQAYLEGAVVVELVPIDGGTAANHLEATKQGWRRPRGWDRLIGTLRADPHGPLAVSLSNPLRVGLVQRTFAPDDDLGVLMPDDGTVLTPEQIDDMLQSRIVRAAYRRPLHGPDPPYTVEQAQQTLSFLAQRMSAEASYRLEWWRVANWVRRWPSVVATALLFAAIGGLYGGPIAVGGGLLVGLAGWIVLRRATKEPVRLVKLRWRRESGARLLIAAALIGGGSGANYAIQYGIGAGVAVLLVTGLSAAAVAAVEAGLTGSLMAARYDQTRTVDPLEAWHNDWRAGVVRGLVGGSVFGTLTGISYGLIGGLVEPVMSGGLATSTHRAILGVFRGAPGTTLYTLVWGVLFGLSFGLVYSHTWPARLAFLQLRFTRRTPYRMLDFLEDACQRRVLRSEGPVYVFFHRSIQESLAAGEPGLI